MRRFLLAVAAVGLGVLLGVLLAPLVLSSETGEPRPTAVDARSQDAVSRNSERDAGGTADATAAAAPEDASAMAAEEPADEATEESTQDPTEEPTEEPRLSPAERADARAGVRDRDIPDAADGTLTVVPGEQDAPAPDADQVLQIRVEVEDGLPIDTDEFTTFVMETLNDRRGWGHDGSVSFARTDAEADIRVVLASPDQVDEMCAPLRTLGLYSCGWNGHAVLNAMRYAQATDEFLEQGSITAYRQYLINHEVGHLLGHHHRECPGPGEVAPVMQQQTISLDRCTPNGWPLH
ncbi:DUF3152 domain-containing protein [Ruania albidiflava]|uniref:DUF3152 domain-containing protein n=1 Tax=Ruania albidiflava TaxID=366586 RepID=UPI0023F20D16|nr:DUF3152 domain-containing protein [Ruania albidiflava]